jgi:hypothetical protein
MSDIQEKCFTVGKELLDLFLIRDNAATEELKISKKFIGIGTISYYDVVYSVSDLCVNHIIDTKPIRSFPNYTAIS